MFTRWRQHSVICSVKSCVIHAECFRGELLLMGRYTIFYLYLSNSLRIAVNPNRNLWPFNPKTIPLACHSLYPVWTLWGLLFLTYGPGIDPVTFDFQPQNHITSRISQDRSLYQIWTIWDHSFLSYAADKQTDSKVLPTPTDRVGVGNNSRLFL